MKRLFLIIFSLFLLFPACKKDDINSLSIAGKVRDGRNNAGLSGVNVNFEEKILEGGAFNSSFQTAAQGNTDGSGNYELDFERKNAVEYQIEFSKNGYFPRTFEINPENVSLDETYTRNAVLNARAEVELQLVNQTPVNSQDQIRFRYLNAIFDDCFCCNNDFLVLQGTAVDSTKSCEIHGDFLIKYVYEVTKNDTTITTVDSLFCPAFTTTQIVITY